MIHARTFVKVSSASAAPPAQGPPEESPVAPTPSGDPAAGDPDDRACPEPAERDTDTLLEAMADPARRRLLKALCTAPDGRAHVAALCGLARVPRGSIGRHLRDLRLRGLILAEDEGRHTFYRRVPARVRLDPTARGHALTLTQPSGTFLTLGVPTAAGAAPAPPTREAARVDASEAGD